MAAFFLNWHVMPWDYWRITIEEREAILRLAKRQQKK